MKAVPSISSSMPLLVTVVRLEHMLKAWRPTYLTFLRLMLVNGLLCSAQLSSLTIVLGRFTLVRLQLLKHIRPISSIPSGRVRLVRLTQ